MKILKFLLLGACVTAISTSFATSKPATQSHTKQSPQHGWSFKINRAYICSGIAPVNIQGTSNTKIYTAIINHLSAMTKMPSEYRCTFKYTDFHSRVSLKYASTTTGFFILKKPFVVANKTSGSILMADKLILNNTTTTKGKGPLYKLIATSKNHIEIGKFSSLKNRHFF